MIHLLFILFYVFVLFYFSLIIHYDPPFIYIVLFYLSFIYIFLSFLVLFYSSFIYRLFYDFCTILFIFYLYHCSMFFVLFHLSFIYIVVCFLHFISDIDHEGCCGCDLIIIRLTSTHMK